MKGRDQAYHNSPLSLRCALIQNDCPLNRALVRTRVQFVRRVLLCKHFFFLFLVASLPLLSSALLRRVGHSLSSVSCSTFCKAKVVGIVLLIWWSLFVETNIYCCCSRSMTSSWCASCKKTSSNVVACRPKLSTPNCSFDASSSSKNSGNFGACAAESIGER